MPDLNTLPTELVLRVLALCDVSAVISFSQTCTNLHSIASTKSLWVAIVARLKSRGFIDHREAPEPTQLSAAQLVELVKRAVLGPASWSPTPGAESIVPKLKEHAKIDPQFIFFDTYPRIQLVRGGEHLLVLKSGVLECYEVALGRKIWTNEPPTPHHHVNDFAVERLEGKLVLAMKFVDQEVALRTCYEIVELDISITEAIQKQLCWLQIDELSPEAVNIISLAGDVLLSTFMRDQANLILDWRRMKLGIFASNTQSGRARATLADNCLAMFAQHDAMQRLLVFDLTSLSAHLAQIEGDSAVSFTEWEHTRLSTLAPALTFDIPGGVGIFHNISSFWMYSNPLSDDTYRIWVSVDAPNTTGFETTLHRLSLYLPRTIARGVASAHLLESAPTLLWGVHPVTFSGHWQRPYSVMHASDAGDESEGMLVVDSKGRHGTFELGPSLSVQGVGHATIAEYSGACTYTTLDGVVVLYFE